MEAFRTELSKQKTLEFKKINYQIHFDLPV